MGATCGVIRPNGYLCINPVATGKGVCLAHDSSRWCGAPTAAGGRCKRTRMRGADRCSIHR